VPVNSAACCAYRLDAVVMLAAVVPMEAPDGKLATAAVDLLREVRDRLQRKWDR
jgi:hypothetical protein